MKRTVGVLSGEIIRLVNEYIGVNGGYLGDFSYRTHEEFYPAYCDLEIDPKDFEGTTRTRFIEILKTARPEDQARIIRGVLKKYPVGSSERRTQDLYNRFLAIAARIEGMRIDFSTIENTHAVVVHALRDAEVMIREGRPVSSVDRVHTALHGHMRYLCNASGISLNGQESITQLYKALRQNVPILQPKGSHAEEMKRLLQSAATILDALNTLRNQGTIAHPNESLLEEAEANLVIHISWSLLEYLDSKLGS